MLRSENLKKLLAFLVILTLILTVNVSFAENETSGLNETSIYVSCDGSDSFGNGTIDNPYQTLNYTIEKASNNTNIYLKSGTYNSTGYVIKNKSISITGIGEVTVDCLNGNISQNIFTIHNDSSLVLNNIKFVNGYADIASDTLSCIKNDGNLYINNCCFDKFRTITGVIYNTNNLHVDEVTTSNMEIAWDLVYADLPSGAGLWIAEDLRKDRSVAEFITNLGNCYIYNSDVHSLHNGRKMIINNSNITEFISNNLTTFNQTIYGNINNSLIQLLRLSNCNMLVINNSYINLTKYIGADRHKIVNSTIVMENSYSVVGLSPSSSNFSASYCIFDYGLDAYSSNMDVHYCVILNNPSTGSFKQCTGNINYNWWGNNRGPVIADPSEVIATYWIVMTFENDDGSDFRVSLNKYTNGNSAADLADAYKLPQRFAYFETESGRFTVNNEYLVNGTLKTSLIDNNPDCIVYATIDNQVLRLAVGTGLTNYTIYVSDKGGHDYFYDGSEEYPYKTLSKAVSKALSGNTIYVLSGNYTLSWNANLKIDKNLTFIGIGDVCLLRPNARNIFIVDEKGFLTVKNINFTTATTDYYIDSFFVLNRGKLVIEDCNFYDIVAQSVIMAKNPDFINLDNVTFNKIQGYAILGGARNILINNSKFSNGTPIYIYSTYYGVPDDRNIYLYDTHNEFYIWVQCSNTTIINSTFRDNVVGIIGRFNAGTRPQHEFWNFEWQEYIKDNVFIYNSTFIDNNWEKLYKIIIGLAMGSSGYTSGDTLIDGCLFYNNRGYMMIATNVTNSRFINNTGTSYYERTDYDFSSKGPSYYPKALMTITDTISNSYFYGNSFLSNDFEAKVIGADKVYYSTFIENKGGYGGALSGPSEVHYCVFINNTATYSANDIFVYTGDLNASSNWWGSNQKPLNDKVHVFLGKLTIDDWVIMSLDYKNGTAIASLDNLLDDNKNIHKLDYILPSRDVAFSTDGGLLNPVDTYLVDNYAYSKLLKNSTSDFDIYAKIDNQNLSLTVYNNSTKILVKNMTLYGKDNQFDVTLININGHRISNQLLNVIIYKDEAIYDTFTLTTDSKGDTSFNIDYPVGKYKINIYYDGNGYFDKSEATSIVSINSISTKLTSHNYTYYGKNNKFYAILQDRSGRYVLNQNLTLKIFNSNNKLISTTIVKTGIGGRADVVLSLDVGTYYLKWTYSGNEWYDGSSSSSVVTVKPINTTLSLSNQIFYGRDNDYAFTFKDVYGNVIRGETITLTVSKGNESKEFKLTTDDKGVASININLEIGVYNLTADFIGDEVYGPAKSSAVLEIQPVRVTFDLNAHAVIPENGVFTAILVDMYDKKVTGENVTLDLYDDGLLKSYYAITDGNGEANFKINMPEGIYFAILNYKGNTWYRETTGASKITVNPNVVINNIYISGNDLVQYYGENKYYVIYFNDSNLYSLNGKVIHVTISSNDWSKSYEVQSDAFGKARIQITLEPGVYNITYKYANEYYDIHGEGSSSIYIYKMPTALLASDLIMNYGEAQFYEVKLVNKNGIPLPNLEVNITVDNKTYSIATNQKGIAKILLDLGLGYHDIAYSFNNDYYVPSNGSSKVLVVDGSQTATKLTASDVEARENSLFNYSVGLSDLFDLPIISSEVILNITDSEGNFIGSYNGYTNSNGVLNFNLNLTYGKYIFYSYYNGNDNYLASFNTNNVNIKALENVTETILFGSDFSIINGDNSTNYFVILSTVDGEFIKNQTVEFIVKGESYYSVTDELGKAYLNVPFAQGSYKVISRFNGSDNLTKASVTNYISVYGEICYLYSMDIIKFYNNATQYYVALFDANNLPLSNRIIKFLVNNESYERLTDSEGFACFDVILSPGVYNITAIYQGEFTDEFVSVNNNITVLTTIIGENAVNYKNTNLRIEFLDNIGNPLSNTEVYFVINSIIYNIKTDSDGIGVFNGNLKAGNYNVIVINSLSGENKTFGLNVKSTISAKNLVKYYKSSSKFKATFLSKNGSPLKNTKVKFTVKGKTYNVKTNGKGVAVLNVNLKPGKYKITSINTKTNEKRTNTLTIKKIIITKNKNVKAGKNINFQAKILKSNGKIAKKVTIKFKINKKTYKIKTNNKGIAKLNLKLNKGKYTVSTTYKGLTVKNKITVK